MNRKIKFAAIIMAAMLPAFGHAQQCGELDPKCAPILKASAAEIDRMNAIDTSGYGINATCKLAACAAQIGVDAVDACIAVSSPSCAAQLEAGKEGLMPTLRKSIECARKTAGDDDANWEPDKAKCKAFGQAGNAGLAGLLDSLENVQSGLDGSTGDAAGNDAGNDAAMQAEFDALNAEAQETAAARDAAAKAANFAESYAAGVKEMAEVRAEVREHNANIPIKDDEQPTYPPFKSYDEFEFLARAASLEKEAFEAAAKVWKASENDKAGEAAYAAMNAADSYAEYLTFLEKSKDNIENNAVAGTLDRYFATLKKLVKNVVMDYHTPCIEAYRAAADAWGAEAKTIANYKAARRFRVAAEAYQAAITLQLKSLEVWSSDSYSEIRAAEESVRKANRAAEKATIDAWQAAADAWQAAE